ncbi:MAG: TRAP transporter substrate-binding protein DctP [Rhodospirillaceae bacterium]|nr:TRAP transporter substrate-binding protein DctP [Rhodospirillaceae bacterium]
MRNIGRRAVIGAVAWAAGMAAIALPVQAEEAKLRALSFLPRNAGYTKSFLAFVDAVNTAGKGLVRIDYVGGPEVTPPIQQPPALRNGVVDMIFYPTGQSINFVPEGQALDGSTTTPPEHRANGGLALLDGIFQKKMNAKIIYHAAGGNAFYLFLVKAPKMKADGGIDLAGLRIRSAAPWVKFVEAIGGTNVVLPPQDVYTSLSRGVVDGTIWPIVGYRDFKWDQYTKVMVEPGFMRTNLLVVANLDKWKALPPAAQALIERLGIEHERSSFEAFQAIEKADRAALVAGGVKSVSLQGEARRAYLAKAYEAPWATIKAKAPEAYDALRAKFYRP